MSEGLELYAPPQAPLIEPAAPPLAGVFPRMAARMLDRGFLIVAITPGIVVASPMAPGGPYEALGFGMMALGTLILFLVNTVLLLRSGQTLAKRFVGVRVVDARGGPADGGQLIVRRVLMPWAISVSSLIVLPFGFHAWWLADAGFIFSDGRRCLHDRLAGTVVVRGEVDPYALRPGR
ncbi:MAG: RDD family protein [Alphaproteobacteria bacterium]|nr:RDD family protein [Alphaproteobacteria bacterium]